jgi:hypothetical protein
MKNKIKAIKAFSKLSTPEMYKLVIEAKTIAQVNEAQVLHYAENLNVHINCHTDSNINNSFRDLTGFYCGVSRLRFHCKEDQNRILVWYPIRDCINHFNSIVGAVIKGDNVKLTCKLTGFKGYDLEHIKEYINGNNLYNANDDMLRLIHDCKTIQYNFIRR